MKKAFYEIRRKKHREISRITSGEIPMKTGRNSDKIPDENPPGNP